MSGIPSWAVKGAEVQCVSVNPQWSILPVETPVVGRKYHLRDVAVDPEDGEVVCVLEEIPDQFCADPRGFGFVVFGLFRFRPLVTRTQEHDVAIFAPLLDQPVLEDA